MTAEDLEDMQEDIAHQRELEEEHISCKRWEKWGWIIATLGFGAVIAINYGVILCLK